MKISLEARAVRLALLCMLACGACSSPEVADADEGPTPEKLGARALTLSDFAGTWATTYGHMRLALVNERLCGTYELGDETATIEGALSRGLFMFRYDESGVRGSGWFELTSDRARLTGEWIEDGATKWLPWSGERVSDSTIAPPPDEPQAYWADPSDIPASGTTSDSLHAFDDLVRTLMVRHQIPCASLSIAHEGVVVVDRAYGYKDQSRTQALPPGTLFRMASLDKMLFTTAAERMVAEGVVIGATGERFTLDLRIFETLRNAGVLGVNLSSVDPRLYDVTIGHLLTHKSGIAVTYPAVKDVQEFLGIDRPPNAMDMLRFKIHGALKSTPGSTYEYNNTASEMLWAILQWINGGWRETIDRYVLGPAGTSEFDLSRTRPADRNANEVWYSTRNLGASIYPDDRGALLPVTDGGGSVNFDNALIASSEALVRYLNMWYVGSGRPLLDAQGKLATGNDNGLHYWYGAWDGTWAMALQRRWTLTNVVVLFNHREERPGVESTTLHDAFGAEMDRAGW